MDIKQIAERNAKVGIIGLGYVGLPLAHAFTSAGFAVVGFDLDVKKVETLMAGESYIKHFSRERVADMLANRRFRATTDFAGLAGVDAIIICVPTPLDVHEEPDLSYVFNSGETIARYLVKGQLVSLESTTYPGTTDEDLRRILEKSGLKAGIDFHLAFSPEREDPNNPSFTTRTIPKVVGGYTPQCLAVANALYGTIVDRTVPVSSTKVAEAAKLLENIFRSVNIALVNEMKMLFDRMGIDVWEVIAAASTKPFGYMAFHPGPGLGGHCIPIDPFYLSWKAREFGVRTRFIELAGEINIQMPHYVLFKTMDALNTRGKAMKGARLLILGIAYKKNVDDMRESPSLKLIELFAEKGGVVDYSDPHIPSMPKLRDYSYAMDSVDLTPQAIAGYDVVVLATDHASFDYAAIHEHARLIVDTRNAFRDFHSAKVVKA